MDKIILIDGNNLVYRSYFATAYRGNFMQNSKGFPTNALFGFANMMNKIILEEQPNYILVAFDKGKTFRHVMYDEYKAGRLETPDELRMQFPKAKEMLDYMGIKHYEIDNYEADDIIGTFAKFCEEKEEYNGLIISSDKDLLQLVTNDVEIKLLKTGDYIRYNETSFIEEYKIDPIRIIDLKALMGDSSDNIPGVKGVGEKTALRLLQDYKTLDEVYLHLDDLTPKLKEKLVNDKEKAYMSYELATICKEVPVEINVDDIKYNKNIDNTKLIEFYEELEFYSFVQKLEKVEQPIVKEKKIDFEILTSLDNFKIEEDSSCYLEILGTNYHTSDILGLAIYNSKQAVYIPVKLLKQMDFSKIKYTYDLKKLIIALSKININIDKIDYDLMLIGYLLDYNVKNDIAYLANIKNINIAFYDDIFSKVKSKNLYEEDDSYITASLAVAKAKFIYDTKDSFNKELIDNEVLDLYKDIELPSCYVLTKMEINGINIDSKVLDDIGEDIKTKLDILVAQIHELAGMEFNISSPKQLGEVLFDHLELKTYKKTKSGYSTNIDVLKKLRNDHPIINKIIAYRMLDKLYSTYVVGLKSEILSDNKIHTIYNQTLTRTGRLSSIEPNLQNIPIRNSEGKLIRKAFMPSKDCVLVSADYSQIELRIFSHIAEVDSLIEAFKNDIDIHSKTASDILGKPIEEVTKEERRLAKAVNFGIIYGISSYGLATNVGIKTSVAKEFIDKYLSTYPGIKEYMNKTILNAHELGYVTTLFNRKRVIEELNNNNKLIRSQGERMALNTPIQGTAADILKIAMIKIDEEFIKQNIKSKMILQVHDELIFDCLKEEEEIVKSIIKDSMENVIELLIPLKVDISVGNTWYDAK